MPRQAHPATELFPMLDEEALEQLAAVYQICNAEGPLAEVAPSAQHPGYWYITVFLRPFGEIVGLKRPILATGVNPCLRNLGRTYLQNVPPGTAWSSIQREPCANHSWFVTAPPAENDDGDVYLIGASHGGLVKIGVATSVRARLATIQRMSPVTLQVLAILHGGGYATETSLHQRFAADRSHGEWFHPSAELFAAFGISS